MKPEEKVKAKVKKLLNQYGCWWYMPVGGSFSRAGVPDFICCQNGKFFAIETKAGGNKATALQSREIGDIRKAGGHAWVVYEEDLEYLEQFLSGALAPPPDKGARERSPSGRIIYFSRRFNLGMYIL